jgi:hypothetical protein
MRYLFVVLMCYVTSLMAEEMYPIGCEPLVVDSENVELAADKYSLIMLHNISNNDLWVIQKLKADSAKSIFTGKISPGKWSTLVVNKKAVKFYCVESKPGHEQQVSCMDVLAICQWPKAIIPKKIKGISWASEDMEILQLIAYIERQGFKTLQS